MQAYDVIVIGAGHNGLAAAAFLARAGRSVLVLEKLDHVGGLASPVEFHPGYRTAGMLHDCGHVRSSVVRALGLADFGLQVRRRRAPVCALSDDGPNLALEPTQAYRTFCDTISPWLTRVFDHPLPEFSGPRGTLRLLRHAASLRLLGRRTMEAFLRVAPMSVADFLDEFTDKQPIRAALAVPTLACSFGGPLSAFGAFSLLQQEALNRNHVIGGGAALVRALEKAASGGAIRTGHAVERILTGADAAVCGVELSDGQTIGAPIVVASCSPKAVFLDLLRSSDVGPALFAEAAHIRSRGTAAHVAIALDTRLCWQDTGRVARARAGGSIMEIERAFDAVKYGQAASLPVLDVYVPTLEEPCLAPDGHEVVTITAHYFPYSSNEDDAQAFTHRVISRLTRYVPGLEQHVVATRIWTPRDIEDRFGIPGGHLYHLEHAPDQLLARPTASSTGYQTPIRGLYLCGSGTHPGGGLTCAPGALAARAILANT